VNIQQEKVIMWTLIARWTPEQDPATDAPNRVLWGNGRLATQRDYLKHCLDTHELVITPNGLEKRMYPGIVGDVRYDTSAQQWFVIPPGRESISLDLFEAEASDADITAALYQLPMVYQGVIQR
jgi:hypothetical protein